MYITSPIVTLSSVVIQTKIVMFGIYYSMSYHMQMKFLGTILQML